MDLEPFHRGVYQLVVLVTSTALSLTNQVGGGVPKEIQLNYPQIESSYNITENIPQENQVLGLKEETIKTEEIQTSLPIIETIKKAQIIKAAEAVEPSPSPEVSPTLEPSTAPVEKVLEEKISTESAKKEEKLVKEETKKEEVKVEMVAEDAKVEKPKNSLNSDVIFQMINDHRTAMGLSPFEKEERLCKIADSRGPALYDEIFTTHTMHKGLYDRNYPFWITENMAHYGSEQAVFNWWLGSKIHRAAIEGNYKYSCGTCYGNSCAQLFTSYIPK